MSSDSTRQASESENRKRFSGVVVPMVTPVTQDGKGDEAGLLRIANLIAKAGAEPFVFGTTGEASSISGDEKLRLTAALCDEYAGKMDIYAGIAGNCFEESVDLAKRFADLGVNAAVANLPSYYELEDEQMLRYFEALADAVPLPLIIYNIPSTTRMSIPLEAVDILSKHDNIVGLKDSERGEKRLGEAIERYKDRLDFSHFVGWAAQSRNALALGSDGLVPSSGNLIPKMYCDLYYAVLAGDMDLADDLQAKTDSISLIYQKDRPLGKALACLKVLLDEMGLCGKSMWPPLSDINGDEEAVLRSRVGALNLAV